MPPTELRQKNDERDELSPLFHNTPEPSKDLEPSLTGIAGRSLSPIDAC